MNRWKREQGVQNIAVVRLVQGRLAWYPPGAESGPRWLDEEGAGEELRTALTRTRLRLCFAAPGEDVRLLELPMASGEKKHIARALPYTLEEQTIDDIESLHFASVSLDPKTLSVALCAQSKMAQWQQLLASWPDAAWWVPEPLLLPWREGEWCMVMESDRAIVRTGRGQGFAVENAMLPTLLEAALVDKDSRPQTVVMYGAEQQADIERLPQALRERVQWRRGDWYTALSLGGVSVAPLNLLQGGYAPRLPLQRWWRQWRAVAAIGLLAFTVQLAASYADYRYLREQNLALRSAVQASYRQAVPRGAVVDAEKQLRRQLDALRGSSQQGGFVSLLGRVGRAVATRPDAMIASINYNDKADEMRMNITADDFEAVEQVRQAIIAAGLEAVMESSNVQGEKVRARLRVGEKQ